MKLAGLQAELEQVHDAAVLVPPRILERVILEVRAMPTLVWYVPHRRCYVLDRQLLFRHVDQEDLNLKPGRLLPTRVILLAQPTAEELEVRDDGPLWLSYWRLLFHGCVHLALDQRTAAGGLSAEEVRQRVEKVGLGAFDEIRRVLTEDHYLLPGADDRTAYVEFAAVFLELRYFARNLLGVYFPGLADRDAVTALLEADVDAAHLFEATRLRPAPYPEERTDTKSDDESNDFYLKLIQNAQRARQTGNLVRAAILHTQAARVAPGSRTLGTRKAAAEDLKALTERLQRALELTDGEREEWFKVLLVLLDKADQGSNPVEAQLLTDLQRVCADNEHDIYTLGVAEWAISLGRKPILRVLPTQRLVRTSRHLRSAAQRLTTARLALADRRHLDGLLQEALVRSEARLRSRFRPVFIAALQDAGLTPANPPEQAAFDKIIEELLDRISALGFFTFSDLRDALSRNQLKLPDLTTPQDFLRGDPLLLLDRRLAALLDGIYQPGEFYMRWLERLSALNFGTRTGRWLTWFVTLPFGGAYAVVKGLDILSGYVLPSAHGGHAGGLDVVLHEFDLTDSYWPIYLGLVGGVGLFFLLLIHWRGFRRRIARVGRGVAYGLYLLLIALPLAVANYPPVRRFFSSWAFMLGYYYVVKPAVATAVIVLLFPVTFLARDDWWLPTTFLFLALNVAVNSRPGQATGDALVQSVAGLYNLLRAGLLPGLYHLISAFFKGVVETVEYLLFTVAEWLRFQSGEGRLALVVRAVLGALWYPISYLTRFYMVVLIEPGFNPLKAPVSFLAAKILWPFLFMIPQELFHDRDHLAVGMLPVYAAVLGTTFLLPDVFGFFFWEFKENWKLYQSNRPDELRPVALGPHGETVRRLLQPGFHSGTVPHLFARLRKAEREALEPGGNWRASRNCWRDLHHIEQAIQRFIDRELLALLRQSQTWGVATPGVGRVKLASNRIHLDLTHPDHPDTPLRVEVETRSGWLVAGMHEAGWLRQTTPDQLRALANALAGLCKLAGVDLIREQLHGLLPRCVRTFELNDRGLVVWPDQSGDHVVFYDFREPRKEFLPRTAQGALAPDWPPLPARRVLFAQQPLTWRQWVDAWQQDRHGQGHPSIFPEGMEWFTRQGGSDAAEPPPPAENPVA